jgi:hypothetical protein
MHLVQFMLPLRDNRGAPFPRHSFDQVRDELAARFGGVTAFLRSPAEGVWKEAGEELVRDEVVIYEVMTEELDRAWWSSYRRVMEERFRQQEVLVRASQIERL